MEIVEETQQDALQAVQISNVAVMDVLEHVEHALQDNHAIKQQDNARPGWEASRMHNGRTSGYAGPITTLYTMIGAPTATSRSRTTSGPSGIGHVSRKRLIYLPLPNSMVSA